MLQISNTYISLESPNIQILKVGYYGFSVGQVALEKIGCQNYSQQYSRIPGRMINKLPKIKGTLPTSTNIVE